MKKTEYKSKHEKISGHQSDVLKMHTKNINNNKGVSNNKDGAFPINNSESSNKKIKDEDLLNLDFYKKIQLEKSRKNREEQAKIKKEHEKIRFTILLCVGSVLLLYLIGVIVFSIFTFPKTIVGDTDISFNTIDNAKSKLVDNSTNYSLTIDGLNYKQTIYGKDIDYKFDSNHILKKINEAKNPLLWPIEIFKEHDFHDNFLVEFNDNSVNVIASDSITKHNSTAVAPVNANFKFDALQKTASIEPEVLGNTINLEKALKSIKSYIGTTKQHLTLTENEQELPILYSNNAKIEPALAKANSMIKTNLTFQMKAVNVAIVDSSLLSGWIYLNANYEPAVNNDLLYDWVHGISVNYNTVGTTRSFVTPYGKSCAVSGGIVGWEIDEDQFAALIIQHVNLGTNAAMDIPCVSSSDIYAGPGGKEWGARYIDLDLTEQHARMYNEAGALVWETDVITGKPDGQHNTPQGVWVINSKESPSILVGSPLPGSNDPEYRTKVDYWMPFVGNGIGFHDATWQSGFGGNLYTTSAGSHGCVNISLSAAASLYQLCVAGDIVVAHF